ncbi:MAG: hypothetical protein A2X81_07990 [Desulfobacterales bacterium GWB2_56_26]|nr:MAG: hypothetical protein A2X81_07990 [Desulfobacterales bacterium GWB2_56_26]
MDHKDYYAILGVDRKAGDKEIKKAYRKLARRHHPDVNAEDETSKEKFLEINEAHQVLSDPEKRRQYDQFGPQWQQHRQAADFNRDKRTSAGRNHTYRSVNPENFEQFFGAGGNSDYFESYLFGRAGRQSRSRQGTDLEHSVQLTLGEAFHGAKRMLEWEDGRRIDAKIPPGVKTGSRVRLKGQGGSGIGDGPPGDLYLTIDILPDERMQRDNNDLKTTVEVDLFTMLLGGKLSVSGIDRTVKLDIPPETRNGRIFRLKGLGMPDISHHDLFGELYVTVEAILPQKLTAGEIDLVEQWRKMRQASTGP